MRTNYSANNKIKAKNEIKPNLLTAISSITTHIFLSLYKSKKNQANFLINNKTEIYQIFSLLRYIQWLREESVY